MNAHLPVKFTGFLKSQMNLYGYFFSCFWNFVSLLT